MRDLGGIPNGIALSPDEKYLYLIGWPQDLKRYEVQRGRHAGRLRRYSPKAIGIGDGMQGRRAGQRLLHRRRGPRRCPRVLAGGPAFSAPSTCPVYGGGAEEADLRHQHRVRRCRFAERCSSPAAMRCTRSR